MLTTRQLNFRYQDEPILRDLSLDFSRHAVTGVIGANGCGKSTLFMNLTGILRPQSGAVLWDNQPIDYSKAGLRALRQRIATVFQDPEQQIFYTDIDSDIAFSLRNLGMDETLIAQRVEQALTLVDAQAFRHKPIQYLSHGQKKRVAVAGALVMEAPYLLLDEPTSGLDPAGREQMIAIIERIVAQGKRVIISSHDIDLIYAVCGYVYVLAHGELVSEGVSADVFLQREKLRAAALVQPWLVKLHSELGLPLCKTEQQLFALLRERGAGGNA
ncbi:MULTISPECIES: ATP-binding cassette domain-containing protein [unclassified Brenneria]|uniref:ATP-binding cassette domain-containing protein n=1 Tax=unclassified Brenneria TaxID=2634434 RepID=UPI0029C30743|nr:MULTISPECIES: ATP-binding cassette domain-containing protein [unclassified Brenneria]MDX5627759.1 ATP-binding cassette domain-containing protein [Brenneria sp. L3-3Z]MDX5695150.1 ATP-binding cassette domain-containing protein [Brenneria sp. L4-2C]MEE3660386.1 ATP-binding cassette domain-containing protein [Brenneria sp. g21c3]